MNSLAKCPNQTTHLQEPEQIQGKQNSEVNVLSALQQLARKCILFKLVGASLLTLINIYICAWHVTETLCSAGRSPLQQENISQDTLMQIQRDLVDSLVLN